MYSPYKAEVNDMNVLCRRKAESVLEKLLTIGHFPIFRCLIFRNSGQQKGPEKFLLEYKTINKRYRFFISISGQIRWIDLDHDWSVMQVFLCLSLTVDTLV